MAPEQLEGKEADARSDLFAFGAVLYEMATGKKAFTGSSQASLIGSILRDDPPAISEISPMMPPALNRVVKTCLAKDPEDRFQTAHDVKLQLQWIAEGGSQAGLPAPVVARRKSREKLAWALAAVAIVVAGLSTLGYLRRGPVHAERIRSYLLPPEKTEFAITDVASGSLTISPNGRMATFATKEADGKTVLWLQPLGETAARKLPGTEGAIFPFWSPDSRFLAFFADKKLEKVDVSGGPPLTLCEADNGRNGAWNRDGVILYSPDSTTGIFRVPAAGGAPKPATTLDTARGETTQRWVTFLPDGRHFLYMAGSHAAGTKSESNAIFVADLDSSEKTLLLQARSNVVYTSGYLLYMREGILMAQRFDPGSRRLSGDPVPVAEGVQYDPAYFRGSFAASENGVLLYATGTGATKTRLRWFDLSGKSIGEPFGEPSEYTSLAVSPDDKRIAAGIADPSTGLPNIWLLDTRGARTRLTAGGPATDSPVWSPDGSRIAYAKLEGRATSVCVVPAAGGKEERVLFLEGRLSAPNAWSPDGRFLAVQSNAPGGKARSDLWIVPMSGGGQPYALIATDADEIGPVFSTDGKWLSYISDESGRPELYVVPFPGPGGKWQISTDGVGGGGFSGRGLEILYGTAGFQVMAVVPAAGPSGLEVGAARALFKMPAFTAIGGRYGGDRFLIAVPPDQTQSSRIGLIANWTAGLAR
jgi:Tol biopolymer transport system component